MLARFWTEGNKDLFGKTFQKTCAQILMWLIPAAMVLFALREPVVRLVFNYGRFDDIALAGTAAAFGVFLVGLPVQGVLLLFVRTFFAMGESKIPLMTAFFASAVTVISAILLGNRWEGAGLALGVTLGALSSALLLFVILSRRFPGLVWSPFCPLIGRVLGLGGMAAGVSWWTYYVTGIFTDDPRTIMILFRLGLSLVPVGILFFLGVTMFKLFSLRAFEEVASSTSDSISKASPI